MKLRIRGNSLRLRLLRGEVEQFGKTGRIAEIIQFAAISTAHLSYVLEADSRAQKITVRFADNQITVTIPSGAVKNWVESEQISLNGEQSIDNVIQDDTGQNGTGKDRAPENVLKILIEKDFVCLDRKDDPDNSDAFPHPTGKCA